MIRARLLAPALILTALMLAAGCGGGPSGSPDGPSDGTFRPLFDGTTLEGWHPHGGGSWTVEDGAIVGRHQAADPSHGLLISDSTYRDFVARLAFKVEQGNSGFYFRAEEVGGELGVEGFQAEVDTGASVAGLYETAGRGWVVEPSPASDSLAGYFDPGGWNRLRVRAVADTLTTWLNGREVAHLPGEAGRREGHLALQLHGGQDMLVRYRDLEIRELSGS